MRNNYDFNKLDSISNPYIKRLNMIIEIDHKTAEAIFHMAGVCYREGQGANTAEYYTLINTLKKSFPDLEKRYCWLDKSFG